MVLSLVVLGTIVPYTLVIAALRHMSATQAGIVGMVEPVVASVVAWFWLGEALSVVQMVGGALVIAGVVIAETARAAPDGPPVEPAAL
jgi:drug/metabolite transporter (DMT)-like permease